MHDSGFKLLHSFGCGWPACCLVFATFQVLVGAQTPVLRRNTEQQRTQQAFTLCRVLDRRSTIIALNCYQVHACKRTGAQYAMSAESRVGHVCFWSFTAIIDRLAINANCHT